MEKPAESQQPATPAFSTRPRTAIEDMLEEYAPYFDLSAEDHDREIQKACRLAMRLWLAKPQAERWRWPEPPEQALTVLERWARECRERPDRGRG